MPIKEREKHVQKIKSDVFSLTDDYEPGEQVVYLDSLTSKVGKEEEKESNIRPNRYGTTYSDQDVDNPAAISDYSYDVELTYSENDVESYYQEESPVDCKNHSI